MNLSPRERELLALIASGLTLYQAARRMHIGYGTAQDYRNRVFDKLGATSSAHAVALAFLSGIDLPVLSLFAPQKNG